MFDAMCLVHLLQPRIRREKARQRKKQLVRLPWCTDTRVQNVFSILYTTVLVTVATQTGPFSTGRPQVAAQPSSAPRKKALTQQAITPVRDW
jgi:hypothetical protein